MLALDGGPPEVTVTPDFRWPRYREEELATMFSYAREGAVSFGLDPRPIRTLEAVAAERFQSRHCLAVSSGTAALHCAFVALEVGPGDEVLCPNYTFYRSVTPLVTLGATPVLVDSEPDLENVDAGRLERFVTPATRGIVITHMVGHPCDLEAVWSVAGRHGLWVVEDAAQAHGAKYRDLILGGGSSDAVCFSMQGHKVANAGQGGLLCTPRRDVYERALLFGYGSRVTHEAFADDDLARFSSGWGLNYQINSLGAALATEHLRRLPEIVAARQQTCDALRERLACAGLDLVRPPVVRDYATSHGWYRFRAIFQGEEAGVDIELYLRALQAEGVHVVRTRDRLMHEEPLLVGRAASVPRFARHLDPESVARDDYRSSEALADRTLEVRVPPLPVQGLVEQYGRAFEKLDQALPKSPRRHAIVH